MLTSVSSQVESPPSILLQEIRNSRLRQFDPVLSGIDKTLQHGQLYVDMLGPPADEHGLKPRGSGEKGIYQYCSANYPFWQNLYPDEPARSRFVPGGFRKNLVADGFDETKHLHW